LVNVSPEIFATGMPCADSNTICARRQVTTDPVQWNPKGAPRHHTTGLLMRQ
jgi:hypothetical protein